MKRNIVGQKPIIFKRSKIYERIDEIIGIAKNYFTSFHSHDKFGTYEDEPYIMENALYVFTRSLINPKGISSIDLQYNGPIPEVFFEDTHIYDKSFPPRSATSIYVNDRFAGYYLPDINSLILTDWTHDSECIKVFKKIWLQLVEKLQLKPVNPALIFENISKVTVGCDPEFELVDKRNGSVIRADCVFHRSCLSSIGTDGAGYQIEFRPKAGDATKVAQNIRKLVKYFNNTNDGYDLTDEGNHYPLGGHIHVGVGFEMIPDSSLITLLDDFVGRPTLPLSGKARNEYLQLGAYRKQPHGFEYRTPPASVFQNPAIACIVMRLVGNLAKKYLTGEVFEYDNENLDIEDYVKYGGLTKNQAKYFGKFCACYKPVKSLTVSWKLSKLRQTNALNIIFRDTWESYIKELITKGLGNVRTNYPTTIVFYGLSKKKYGNNKATIEISNCSIVPGKVSTWNPEKRILAIGLSYDRRMHLTFSESVFMQSLVEAIYQKLDEVEA